MAPVRKYVRLSPALVVPVRVFIGKAVSERDIDPVLLEVAPLLRSVFDGAPRPPAADTPFLVEVDNSVHMYQYAVTGFAVTAFVNPLALPDDSAEQVLDKLLDVQIAEPDDAPADVAAKKQLAASYFKLHTSAKCSLYIERPV